MYLCIYFSLHGYIYPKTVSPHRQSISILVVFLQQQTLNCWESGDSEMVDPFILLEEHVSSDQCRVSFSMTLTHSL